MATSSLNDGHFGVSLTYYPANLEKCLSTVNVQGVSVPLDYE